MKVIDNQGAAAISLIESNNSRFIPGPLPCLPGRVHSLSEEASLIIEINRTSEKCLKRGQEGT